MKYGEVTFKRDIRYAGASFHRRLGTRGSRFDSLCSRAVVRLFNIRDNRASITFEIFDRPANGRVEMELYDSMPLRKGGQNICLTFPGQWGDFAVIHLNIRTLHAAGVDYEKGTYIWVGFKKPKRK